MLRIRSYWLKFLMQSASACAALVLAWLLRFDFTLPKLPLLLTAVPLIVAIRTASVFGLTNGNWRYTGLADLKELVKVLCWGTAVFFVLIRYLIGLRSFPLSIYVIEAMLSLLMLGGLRVGARLVFQARASKRAGARVPVLIVGAGAAATLLLRELEHLNSVAIGLIDDDAAKQNTRIGGIPVLGRIDQIPAIARRFWVAQILIAIPSATGAQMLRITDFCGRSGVPFRAVPSLADLIQGKVTISELHPVNLEDLLGREPVRMETDEVRARLCGKVVMVTGAAGSIGSELCKQILRCQVAKLICVDQAETPLFNLQQHVLSAATAPIVYSVTDITDRERMSQLLQEHDVNVIFHAAAYKHVPMMESNPYEGLKNNVFGLLDLVETAEQLGCEDFVLVSTDKAVNPSSLMGCTKRLGEMIVGSRIPSRMRCVSVRFGNVLGSQGSVIPLFQEQIRSRSCVTVTHPEMTRYFMTVPEAVSLVLQAFTVGEHGDILVLDMGKPVRILDLAKTLIRMSGKRESDVHILFTGMRPGEKLHEELFYKSEVRFATSIPQIMRAQTQLPSWAVVRATLEMLRNIPCDQNGERTRAQIKLIIPEYQWQPADKPVAVLMPFPPKPVAYESVPARSNIG